jgi:hypothetical protein
MPSATDWLMFGVVVGIGVPAAFRSPVAFILVIWWLVGNGLYHALGGLTLWASVTVDTLAFIAVARVLATPCDLTVLVLFFPTLAAHAILTGHSHWLMTWLLGMTQFLLAGGSALMLKSWRDAEEHSKKIHSDIDRLFVALRTRATAVLSGA